MSKNATNEGVYEISELIGRTFLYRTTHSAAARPGVLWFAFVGLVTGGSEVLLASNIYV